jgi:antitoxin Phd
MDWRLAEAKNRLSEVIGLALREGPQRITRRKEAVMVISEAEYRSLRGRAPRFVDHLLHGPSLEGLDLARDRSGMRDGEI